MKHPKSVRNSPQISSKVPHFPSFCEEVNLNQKVQNSLILGGNVKILPPKMRKSAKKCPYLRILPTGVLGGDNLKDIKKNVRKMGGNFGKSRNK